ncbi:MAG: SWIM zinc finger family protein [Bacteroidia bacterium]|nr:SWIM zinc finger family protein [Bacteroidia bacterium]
MASTTLDYLYNSPSSLAQGPDGEQLLLSKFSEVERGSSSCFFWGRLHNPYVLSRCLITLSKTVQSSFSLSPFEIALLKDPIVTAGNNRIRFEAFSHCAGVYGRVDVLEGGQDGEFLENGTTNVDFNPPLIAELSRIKQNDELMLSVGKKEVGFHKDGKSIIERKVPLPSKWIKGLTTVQHYFSETETELRLSRIQALQLFQSLPKGSVKVDYYLIKRGNKYSFSQLKSSNAITIGGVHRLKLIKPLISLVKSLHIYPHPNNQSISFILKFDQINFIFSLSRDSWRGFSGEGAVLEELLEDIPDKLIQAFDNYTFTNQVFNPTLLSIEEDIELKKVDKLATKLAAMGLLGFDLEDNGFFYRRLPFKLKRILSLNPRLKNADKLLAEGKVKIVSRTDNKVEARVEGSGVWHYVLLEGENSRCTCMWFSRNQGERGICKHILAVKKMVQHA